MFKKVIKSLTIVFTLTTTMYAAKITENECLKKENFIFAGGECIEYRAYKADSNDAITIIVHGTWDAGTNTLGRYAPFAETMNLNTDLTTIAVALPGYSGSSTNNFEALAHEGTKNLAARVEYIEFLGKLVEALKNKYKATTVNYIGHSAGAMMGATLTGIRPDLIQNIALAGGRYDIHEKVKDKDLISIIDVLDKVNKDTKFLLIYGTADKISKPEVTTNFYEIAKNKSFDVKLIKVENAPHLDLDMTDTSVEAITEFLGE
jgi:pimeloyl-ACP methyl ester carboxylesterase